MTLSLNGQISYWSYQSSSWKKIIIKIMGKAEYSIAYSMPHQIGLSCPLKSCGEIEPRVSPK